MTDIISVPLNKLVPSQANVRRVGRESGIEELAASIAAHGLLQNLTVRPVRDDGGGETGRYEVVAGGRRLVALQQLARAKRIKKAAPVPCALHADADPVEISLAENVTQLPMHPADQYAAFATLHGDGMTADDIAARFGIAVTAVRQRMKLGAVSPALLQNYRDGGMNLEQLMTFTITDDHARQERVWSELSWNKGRDMIRRLLTEGQVPAHDRRALFVGCEAYATAGGTIVRDLFDEASGGFLSDPALLDRLVKEKLDAAGREIAAEGWKWVEVHPEFNYGLASGLRRVYAVAIQLAEQEQARLDALESEYEALSIQHEGQEASPDMEATFDRLEAEIDALRGREAFRSEDVTRGGAFVSLGYDGKLRVERGFIRPDHEPVAEPSGPVEEAAGPTDQIGEPPGAVEDGEAEEPDGLGPLSDKLVEDLTTERTAALQDRLAASPDIALCAVVHALALRLFYPSSADSCLKIQASPVAFGNGVGDGKAGRALATRQDEWGRRLPAGSAGLWAWIVAQDDETRRSLLAFCAARTVSAVRQPWAREPARVANVDALAVAVALDMAEYWTPTAANYFSRVTKAHILNAIREAASEDDADRMAGLKKADMANEAERLLAEKQWLPGLLRTADRLVSDE
jgi:ParB family chromosome partitioning protein